jgi:hypothetical protein
MLRATITTARARQAELARDLPPDSFRCTGYDSCILIVRRHASLL